MHSNLLLLCLTDTTAAYFTCCSSPHRPTTKGSSLRVYTLKAADLILMCADSLGSSPLRALEAFSFLLEATSLHPKRCVSGQMETSMQVSSMCLFILPSLDVDDLGNV